MAGTWSAGASCQSCGMPLVRSDELGTEANGGRTTVYCRHCYASGAFTAPAISMEQMLERCVALMVQERILPEGEARGLMRATLPNLRRWQPSEVAAG